MGNEDSPFGTTGALHRSRDRGWWETLPLPIIPNGSMWDIATHYSDPTFLMAGNVNAQVFLSHDAGDSRRSLRVFCGSPSLAALPS